MLVRFLPRLFALLLAAVPCALADEPAIEPPVSAENRAALQREFAEKITILDAEIAAAPSSTRLLSERGDAHLFLAHFDKAVADFERMIQLDPALDAPHWRLGIAYYFA